VSSYRLLIPTTRHAVEILSITVEDPEIRSVICLNDSFQPLPISTGYDQFVRRPTGVIEKLLGPASYRVDVSAPITQGDSWQLGFCLAHLLHHQGRFSAEDAAVTVWATGEIDPQFGVRPVEHIAAKIEVSRPLLEAESLAGRKLVLLTAAENLQQLRDHIPEEWSATGVSTLGEACAAIGIKMPNLQPAKTTAQATPPKSGRSRALRSILAMFVIAAALVAFNIPYKSLLASYGYEQEGQLRALRMEMRKIGRQKNWVATNAYYFFEVFFLLNKSKRLQDSLAINLQFAGDSTNVVACATIANKIVAEQNLIRMPNTGCSVTFSVQSNARSDVRIWLALIDEGAGEHPLTLMKHGADLRPGEQFMTPVVTIRSQTTRLFAAVSDRPDQAWLGWFDNLLKTTNADRMELETDRLTSTGVGVFQAQWMPFVELD